MRVVSIKENTWNDTAEDNRFYEINITGTPTPKQLEEIIELLNIYLCQT